MHRAALHARRYRAATAAYAEQCGVACHDADAPDADAPEAPEAPEEEVPEVVLPELTWNGMSCMGPNG